jgi:hypothetical protein
MTQEIIEMARQAGMAYEEKLEVYVANIDDLQDFAKLVEDAAFKRWAAQTKLAVEVEREACAKLVEDSWMAFAQRSSRLDITPFPELKYVAKVIRARRQE